MSKPSLFTNESISAYLACSMQTVYTEVKPEASPWSVLARVADAERLSFHQVVWSMSPELSLLTQPTTQHLLSLAKSGSNILVVKTFCLPSLI